MQGLENSHGYTQEWTSDRKCMITLPRMWAVKTLNHHNKQRHARANVKKQASTYKMKNAHAKMHATANKNLKTVISGDARFSPGPRKVWCQKDCHRTLGCPPSLPHILIIQGRYVLLSYNRNVYSSRKIISTMILRIRITHSSTRLSALVPFAQCLQNNPIRFDFQHACVDLKESPCKKII